MTGAQTSAACPAGLPVTGALESERLSAPNRYHPSGRVGRLLCQPLCRVHVLEPGGAGILSPRFPYGPHADHRPSDAHHFTRDQPQAATSRLAAVLAGAAGGGGQVRDNDAGGARPSVVACVRLVPLDNPDVLTRIAPVFARGEFLPAKRGTHCGDVTPEANSLIVGPGGNSPTTWELLEDEVHCSCPYPFPSMGARDIELLDDVGSNWGPAVGAWGASAELHKSEACDLAVHFKKQGNMRRAREESVQRLTPVDDAVWPRLHADII
jgi:hypothetical protein